MGHLSNKEKKTEIHQSSQRFITDMRDYVYFQHFLLGSKCLGGGEGMGGGLVCDLEPLNVWYENPNQIYQEWFGVW